MCPTSSTKAQERFEALKAMHLLVKLAINYDLLYGPWPLDADATDEDLYEAATDELDVFAEAVEVFINYFSEYTSERGLYVGGERWPE